MSHSPNCIIFDLEEPLTIFRKLTKQLVLTEYDEGEAIARALLYINESSSAEKGIEWLANDVFNEYLQGGVTEEADIASVAVRRLAEGLLCALREYKAFDTDGAFPYECDGWADQYSPVFLLDSDPFFTS